MNTTESSIRDATKEKLTESFARFGIVSKGVVYCLIGILTSLAAFRLGGAKADKAEAFELIYSQPMGKVLLLIIAIGLLGYVTWRFFQSVFDSDDKGNNTKAAFIRLGYGISALIYLALAIYAIRLALTGTDGGDSSQSWVSKGLSYPAGVVVIAVTGVITAISGIRQIYKAVSGKFMKNVQLTAGKHSELFRKTGIAGYISRGIVLIIIGYFFVRAAVNHNANEAVGTRGAFSFLENNFGSILLGIVALGLVGYGVFMFVKGKYQRIDINF